MEHLYKKVFCLDSAKTRHRRYLGAMLGSGNDGDDLLEPGYWESWAKKQNLKDPPTVGSWLAQTVRLTCLRIDELSLRRSKTEAEFEKVGLAWAHGCSRGRAECIEVRWGPEILQATSGRIRRQSQTYFWSKDGGDKRIGTFPRRAESYEIFFGAYSQTGTLGFFPFYLTASRRRAWSVLQFGVQRHLAFVGHKETLDELFGDAGQCFGGQEALNTSIDAERFAAGISKLADDPQSFTFWYFGVGHAAFEIALETLASPEDNQLFRRCLRDVNTSFDSEEAKEIAEIPRELASRPHIVKERLITARNQSLLNRIDSLNEASVLISDLGVLELQDLRRLAEEGDRQSIQILRFDHGLQVPVGLGFSLCTVPMFLQYEGLFRGLIESVERGIRSVEEENFETYGVAIQGIDAWRVGEVDERKSRVELSRDEQRRILKAVYDVVKGVEARDRRTFTALYSRIAGQDLKPEVENALGETLDAYYQNDIGAMKDIAQRLGVESIPLEALERAVLKIAERILAEGLRDDE